jgi:hypothetical protein
MPCLILESLVFRSIRLSVIDPVSRLPECNMSFPQNTKSPANLSTRSLLLLDYSSNKLQALVLAHAPSALPLRVKPPSVASTPAPA